MRKFKTFDDLEFKPKRAAYIPYDPDDRQAILMFPNGFGVSVIRGPHSYGGPEGLYELAVFDKKKGLCYTTCITDDVLGHLTPERVTALMRRVQRLKPRA